MSKETTGISKHKIQAIAIAIFLTLSMCASMMLMPSVHAATTIPSFNYISVSPNPTGVGQQVEIIMWVEGVFGGNAELTNTYRFANDYQLIITAPDGTNTSTTFGTVTSPTSDYDYSYTPTATGTYTLTFNFLATTITSTNDPTSGQLGDEYLPTTTSTTLVVQSTPIAAIPQTPLPTAFWTRPIYGENSAWYTLGSNWLGFGSPGYISISSGPNAGANGEEFGQQYLTNVGPLTSHIMWTMPLLSGGVVGQDATTIAGNTYSDGSAYDQKFCNPIIVDGLLIFTESISQTGTTGALAGSTPAYGPTVCYNLESGQLVWSGAGSETPHNPVPALSFAYIYDPEDPNQHGVWPPMLVASAFSYVTFSTVWEVFDAYTGDALFNVTNIPSAGASMLGPSGEYLQVSLTNYGNTTNPNWYLQEWNSSRLWENLYSGPSTTPTYPPPITNATTTVLVNGINQVEADDFNISVPWLDTATLNGAPIGSVTQSAAIYNDILLIYAGTYPANSAATESFFFGTPSSTPYEYFGVGLNATGLAYVNPSIGGDTSAAGSVNLGSELWSNVVQPPPNNITVLWAGIDPKNNVFIETWRETQQFVGYSLSTGKEVWGPTAPQAALDYYGCQASGSISCTVYNGDLISSAYAGIIYCYSTATGDILWTFGNGGEGNSTNSGVETPFGVYPTFVVAVGNGVVYVVTSEHTEETPIFKGALARALNATTGQEIWTLSDYTGEFFTGSYAIADGYSVFFNGYDNSVYNVGTGPSATTVTAPQTAITEGSNVIIQGTVMDTSVGTQQLEQKADFPNGVPCASDASMTQWMGYVYQQQPEPTNFTGVVVTLTAIDPNHNFITLGEATTDANGMYHFTWTLPSIPGTYSVTATFCGSNGYYGSTAETNMYVASSPASPAPTASPVTGLASTASLELGIAAVIIVIIIIGAILALLLMRKRP